MPNYLSKIKPNGANGEEYKFKDEEVREAVINVQANVAGTKTLTGDIISVSDAAPILAENVTSAIDPIQDLHGYDHPWVGGAGKNKFDPVNYASYLQLDGTYLLTTSPNGIVTTIPTSLLNQEVTFSCRIKLPTGSTAESYRVCWYHDSNRIDGTTDSTADAQGYKLSKVTFTPTDADDKVSLRVGTMDNLIVKDFQLELGDTVTSFAPYSNICPIQGHDMCEVVRTGVNIWDEEWEVGDIDNNGQPQSSSTLIRTKNFNPCQPSTTYYVKAPTGISIYVKYYDKDKNFISPTVTPVNNTITTPSTCAYFKFVIGSAYGTTYNNDISINYPSTDTQYHAYTGQTYPIQIGNKNQLQLDLDTIKSFNTDGVWSGNTYALNGVELTVVTDDDGLVTEIKVVSQGSVSNDVIFKIASITYKADVEYILNGCPTGGSSNEYAIWSFDIGSEDVDVDEGDGVEIEKSSDTAASVCIRIRYLYGASNLSFKPMLRFASITNSDFSPYNPLFAQQGMCFGGELDVTNGVLRVDKGFIASYNGETLPSTWISDRDVYAAGTTPTTGAEVCYKLATPIIYHLTPTEIQMLLEYNNLWSNTGDLTVKYQPNNVIGETKEYVIDNFLSKTLGLMVKDGKLCQRYIKQN